MNYDHLMEIALVAVSTCSFAFAMGFKLFFSKSSGEALNESLKWVKTAIQRIEEKL